MKNLGTHGLFPSSKYSSLSIPIRENNNIKISIFRNE
ncbi:hypothetical protein LTSESEN_3465, partial [Salmonella enterica subsp. enterica serovar Senftenberg str. A4-543]